MLRTPLASIDHLSIRLPDPDASKMQWTLECYSGKYPFSYLICLFFLQNGTCIICYDRIQSNILFAEFTTIHTIRIRLLEL